ncbi:hypothetical protein [Myceligenerans crystallogenes]|uniref:Uncharacterized protein n=1 Tax=Myceligenerans crystallogenes TaxID=316335 RepID=A0ABN2NL65_9MICO
MPPTPSAPTTTWRIVRNCLIWVAVVLVVLILLGTWFAHELSRAFSGQWVADEAAKAQEHFGDDPAVVGVDHDSQSDVTIELAPSTDPAREYAGLAADVESYFDGFNDARGVIRIDGMEMELIEDDDARSAGLRLMGELSHVDGIDEATISLTPERNIFGLDVFATQGRDGSIIDLYHEVRQACLDVGSDALVVVSVAGSGGPGGYINDTHWNTSEGGGRGTGLAQELSVYGRYARQFDVTSVAIEPGAVGITIDGPIRAARAQAHQDNRHSTIQITVERLRPRS